jgi:hypothetical protein
VRDESQDICGREDRCAQGFGGETSGKNYMEFIVVDGRVILKWHLNEWN